jgi:pre-rRNA-processing protein TSR4
VALASTTLEDTVWKATPAYEPLYLSTLSEYLPSHSKQKLPANVQVVGPDIQDKNDPIWNNESYENSLEIDHVFDRFTKRVANESEQCLRSARSFNSCISGILKLISIPNRYDLKGTPLPFAKDPIFDKLFPPPTSDVTTVSKAVFNVSPPVKRTFTPSSDLIPPCPSCKSPRVFECQLMPNLINVLKVSQDQQDEKRQTNEERKKAVERALKSGDGMSWGTAMVFSCESDCCLITGEGEAKAKEAKECWREEVVLVQWDT